MRFLLVRLLQLAAAALLAAGLSGLLAEPLSWKTGMDYLTGDHRARVGELSVERCAELIRLHRRQITCAGALVEDRLGELVQFGAVAALAGGALLGLLGRFGRPARGGGEAVLEATLLTAAAVAFAAVAATELPGGVAGAPSLVPGSGRGLLQGGAAALGAAWLGSRALAAWRHLAS